MRTWELTGFSPSAGTRFSIDEWLADDFAMLDVPEIAYEATPGNSPQEKRLVEEVRTQYRSDDLSSVLAVGELESLALPGETFKRALTPTLVSSIFGSKLASPAAVLESTGSDGGGYASMDGAWWIHSGRAFFSPSVSAPVDELAFAQSHFFVPHRMVDVFGNTTIVSYDDDTLLPTDATDAVGDTVRADNDYRVRQPWQVTDSNGNRIAAAFDALGLVVATATLGKTSANEGDELTGFPLQLTLAQLQAFSADTLTQAPTLLGHATTRLVYDLERFARCGQPPFVATLARETHYFPAEDNATAIQVSFSFSDGFGREVQKKVRAEDGSAPTRATPVTLPSSDVVPGALQSGTSMASPRWVGSGRVVFNNKGKPVKQYEPFFSATHLYEDEAEVTETGVSPVLFYDPVGRVVATLHPNHAYEKVVFDNWRQSTWDANDTSTLDPRTDADISGYVAKYFEAQPSGWQTWAQRQSDPTAVTKTQAHANTPAIAHLDSQGRVFLTLADNGISKLATRVDFDIEGNQRAVSDALGRVVMKYDYDMVGTRLHQASMEAGERWTLADATGKPIRAWDSRDFIRRMTYDELRRPTGLYVTEAGVERLAEKVVYGESQGDVTNHRTRVFQSFDAAGVVTSLGYDFKGNLLASRRDVAVEYKTALDWSASPALGESFDSSTEYDALNRPLAVTAPDGSVYRPTFNEANLLEAVDVKLRGASTETPFVANLAYNAKGQREAIAYANGATTEYSYDAETLRLTRLKTTRPANPDALVSQLFASVSVVQDIGYVYDAVGNILKLADAALAAVFYDNQQVTPECAYTYDALYRLIDASGRESIGQTDFAPDFGNTRDFPFVGSALNPNDLQALRRFTESYEYDDAGNLLSLAHTGWTRDFTYEEASQLEPGKVSNRLTSTTVGASTNSSAYDVHGNMLGLPHISSMEWNFKDEFQQASLGGGGTAYYVYDSAGQRVRKVLESQLGVRRSERLYLGGFEVWREYQADGVTIETVRKTLHVMDDKQRIALVETLTVEDASAVTAPTPRLRYQLGNHLGSSSVELDEVAALISYEEYHPYGTTALQAHNTSAEVSLKRYRYTAKERDDETGLNYHGARYYAPWLARWTNTDPSGTKDSLNLFQYVRSNPVGNVDLTGRETGAWSAIVSAAKRGAGYVVGAAEGLGERAVSIVKMNADPGGALVDLGAAVVANYKEGAKGGGGVGGGLLAAANTGNPVFSYLVAKDQEARAEASGDSFEAGRQSAKADLATLDTLMLATGGAKAATGAWDFATAPSKLNTIFGKSLDSAVGSLKLEFQPRNSGLAALKETLTQASTDAPKSSWPQVELPSGERAPASHYGGGFHGTSLVKPEVALKEGFSGGGSNWNIEQHSLGAPESALMGTTPVSQFPQGGGAATWAGEGGFVYELRNIPTFDVNQLLQGRVARPGKFGGAATVGEVEGAVPRTIPPEKIYRYGQVELNANGLEVVVDWILNPNFK